MDMIDYWELASYVVTVVGLPFAIVVFIYDRRRERDNEEEEEYQLLANAYNDFLKVVLAHPDLHLRNTAPVLDFTAEQEERIYSIFDMLISLFERAYLLAYAPDMPPAKARRWNSWEDYMREWCRRQNFVVRLPELLRGEDAEFAAYIRRLAAEENPKPEGPADAPTAVALPARNA
ncbi:MAG: hypothetical protein H0U63_07490 [Burkholderiales bacterium]|nr:hypothetical protein [Burkholderiales bacterium]